MGNFPTLPPPSWWSAKPLEVGVLLTGLDLVGKTTLLYKKKLDLVVSTTNTSTYNVESIDLHNGIVVVAWDEGGNFPKLRPLYRSIYHKVDAIMFVVDSTDRERIDKAYNWLRSEIIDQELLHGKPLLTVLNKQDLPGAMSVEEITEKLDLSELATTSNLPCHVLACSATTGQGVDECFAWIGETVQKMKSIQQKQKDTSK